MDQMQNAINHVGVAITICDLGGQIVYMNEKAQQTFFKFGGKNLVGKSLYECHKPESVEKIKEMLLNNTSNSYTIFKNGVKKLVHQTPWVENSKVKGMIEFSIEIPEEMEHFVRS